MQDSFRTGSSPEETVSVAFALLDVCRDSRAVGIGMRGARADALSVGLDTDLTGHRLQNLAVPLLPADAATKDYVDEQLRALAELLERGRTGGNP